MNKITNPLTIKGLQGQSTYSIYKRLANLVLVVIGVVICINLWLYGNHHAQAWHDKQADQLGRALAKQGALSLATALAQGKDKELQQRLADLLSDNHVTQVGLYNQTGKLLHSTTDAPSIVDHFRQQPSLPLVFVEQVNDGDKVIGYLRLYLSRQEVMRYHDEYQNRLFEQTQVLVLLAIVVGVILTRAFYKLRYRHLLN